MVRLEALEAAPCVLEELPELELPLLEPEPEPEPEPVPEPTFVETALLVTLVMDEALLVEAEESVAALEAADDDEVSAEEVLAEADRARRP